MGLADRRVLSVSLAVTVLQYALFTFLPYLFGEGLASTAFMWPHIPISFAGIDYSWNVLGYEVARNAAGEVVIGGGLGYFLSYEIGSFVVQCVNFPLQRNVTFKSHGNVAYQILWYFIAWVLISLFCNAINGLWLPLAQARCVGGAVGKGRLAANALLPRHLEHLAERQSDQRRHGEFEDFVTEGIGIVQSLIALGVHFPVDVAQGRYHTVRCRFQIWRFTHGSIVMRDRRAFLPIRMGEARSGMMLRFPKTRGSKCRGSWAGSVRVGI